MRRRPLPIRWRLTLWYGVLLLAGFAILGAGLYVGLRHLLVDDFDEQRDADVALVLGAIRQEGDALALDGGVRTALADDEHVVRLYDRTGALTLDESAAVGAVPAELDRGAVAAALTGASASTVRRVAGEPFAIVTRPVVVNGETVGAAQIGIARGDIDDTLRLLLLAFAVVAPLAAIGAMVGGYLLAGRALAPVAAITDLAAGIDADDLHARLRLDLPDDELGRLARTFDAMLARIEEQVERQRRFTGDAAHELRTPIAAMRGEIDLALARPRDAAAYRAALTRLDGDLVRLTALLSALLALARADDARLRLDRAPFDLAEVVEAVVEQMEPSAAERGVTLAATPEPAPAVADADLIAQVLTNLVDNALAATPAGGRVTVGCRPVEGGVTAWVADTGRGIPAEHQTRVFDRFYRVDEGRARDRGGAGLGLSICREIVATHGGTVSLESVPGEGTLVAFTLPTALSERGG